MLAEEESGRFGPLPSYPFAVLALSDIPFENSLSIHHSEKTEGRIDSIDTKYFTPYSCTLLRFSLLMYPFVTEDTVRGYFSKGTSLRTLSSFPFVGFYHQGRR